MTHRAIQIVDQLEALHQAAAAFGSVETLRDRDELLDMLVSGAQGIPVCNIDTGADVPPEEDQLSFSVIDSELEIVITFYETGSTKKEVVNKLYALRAASHVVMYHSNDTQLGLAFVSQAVYGGAAAPDIREGSARIIGRLDTRWIIRYRMQQSSAE